MILEFVMLRRLNSTKLFRTLCNRHMSQTVLHDINHVQETCNEKIETEKQV